MHAATDHAAAFTAVVGRDPMKRDDYEALARQAAQLDTFTGLMNKLQSNAAKPAGKPTPARQS